MEESTQQTPLEAWFAEAGLEVIEVAACPVADCPLCQAFLDEAA